MTILGIYLLTEAQWKKPRSETNLP